MTEINTTRLMRRIARYCSDQSGGRSQSGETAFGREAVGEATFVRRLRNGAQCRQPTLEKAHKFLEDRGY